MNNFPAFPGWEGLRDLDRFKDNFGQQMGWGSLDPFGWDITPDENYRPVFGVGGKSGPLPKGVMNTASQWADSYRPQHDLPVPPLMGGLAESWAATGDPFQDGPNFEQTARDWMPTLALLALGGAGGLALKGGLGALRGAAGGLGKQAINGARQMPRPVMRSPMGPGGSYVMDRSEKMPWEVVGGR